MLHQSDENGVYARVYAAPMRRLFAYAMLVSLGALLLWLVFTTPPTAGWAVVMGLIAVGALYLAERTRRATATVLELTAEELRDSSGRVLARVEDIEKIDRGVFAFKPSNGGRGRCRAVGAGEIHGRSDRQLGRDPPLGFGARARRIGAIGRLFYSLGRWARNCRSGQRIPMQSSEMGAIVCG